MKEFISHIDYLIQKYDCVIIPEFGGFVLNHEEASIIPNGSIAPPRVTIGFNPDLKYNDGLLAESYMNVRSLSYEEACKEIKENVKQLETVLKMKHPVQIGNLGKLTLGNDEHVAFIPNNNLSITYPDTFGLSHLNIKRLSQLDKEAKRNKTKHIIQRLLVGAGATAAAVLVFFIASTPVKEEANIQKSSFFTDIVSSFAASTDASVVGDSNSDEQVTIESEIINPVKTNSAPTKTADVSKTEKVKEVQKPEIANNDSKPEIADSNEKSNGNYFVIVGGAKSDSEANNLLKQIKEQGLNTAQIIKSENRKRVYVASFATKKAAEDYLVSFKNQHPKFHDAWVYYKN